MTEWLAELWDDMKPPRGMVWLCFLLGGFDVSLVVILVLQVKGR